MSDENTTEAAEAIAEAEEIVVAAEADEIVAEAEVVAEAEEIVAEAEQADAPARAKKPVVRPRRPKPAQGGIGTGRRKEAVARVRLTPGSGKWLINGEDIERYFPSKVHRQTVTEPFRALDLVDSFDVVATVKGGGMSGQAGAVRLGISRALNESDLENYRPSLKKAALLTRDARVKERKKAGLKKARKAPQYSKR